MNSSDDVKNCYFCFDPLNDDEIKADCRFYNDGPYCYSCWSRKMDEEKDEPQKFNNT